MRKAENNDMEEVQKLLEVHRKKGEKVILDIGCGKVKRGNIGIDLFPGASVDVVTDFGKGIPFPDGSADEILMYHSLEHVIDPVFVMEECHRVLKAGGLITIKVPHHSNVSAYQIHHKSYWNYYSLDPILGTGEKSNEQQELFSLVSRKLNLVKFKFLSDFFSARPFLYEMYFYRIFPCYEIQFVLRK